MEAITAVDDILEKSRMMVMINIKINNEQERQVLETITAGFKLFKKYLEVNLGSKISKRDHHPHSGKIRYEIRRTEATIRATCLSSELNYLTTLLDDSTINIVEEL